MIHGSFGRPLRLAAGLAMLALVVACAETGPTSSIDDGLLTYATDFIDGTGAVSPDPTAGGKAGGAPDVEFFEICKRWVGAAGVATFSVTDGATTHSTSTNDGTWVSGISALGHSDWSCRDVWIEGGDGAVVTATETGTSGANPYTLTLVQALAIGTGNTPTIGADYVMGRVDGATASGVTAFFTNTEEIPPPGDEGCTPGYWKQPHHFGNWATYGQSDSYDGTFGVASSFGGSLLDALKRGGGGENALGRHATAALLNAASSGVNAMYSTGQVIAMVQAAYASGDFESTKNMLAAANELGCPLGRAP